MDETFEIGQPLRGSHLEMIFDLAEIDACFILRRKGRDLGGVEIVWFSHDGSLYRGCYMLAAPIRERRSQQSILLFRHVVGRQFL